MSYDGIVLDLDDTILDTTRLLLPAADRRAIAALRAHGLAFGESEALARLTELREAGAAGVFESLAEEGGARTDGIAAARQAFFVYADLVPPLEIAPRTTQALDALGGMAPLALLTTGDPPTQRRKIERAGIAHRFDATVIAPLGGEGKTHALAGLLADRGWDGARVATVGDRMRSDIRAGNANGCVTVLVRSPGAEFAAETPRDAADEPGHVCADLLEAAEWLTARAS